MCDTNTGSASTASLAASNIFNNDVLLPTAKVKVVTRDGAEIHLKALLDSGFQLTFITQRALQLLNLKPAQSNVNVVGITNSKTRLKHCLPLEIHSVTNPFKVSATCHVVEQITCKLPQHKFDISNILIPKGIKLADDQFNIPAEIDLLMGADIFFQMLLPSELPELHERQQSAAEANSLQPHLVNTQFGYIVGGTIPHTNLSKVCNKVSLKCNTCESDINETLTRFWKTEDVPKIYDETSSAQMMFQSSVNTYLITLFS